MTEEIEVPDGKTLVPYFVDTENIDLAVEAFASMVAVDILENGDERFTERERSRIGVTAFLDRFIVKYQKQRAARTAEIVTDIVS